MAIKNQLTDCDDQRRIKLLNDPNYGIVLCFLEKFRSVLDIPPYPFQQFEDHLVNCEEEISPCLIDFHFSLLKRLSLARNAQRDNFHSIITKVASRYDLNASKHLMDTGYLQADISVKTQLIKNLLESQFDVHQTFKNMLISQSASEINSAPSGRDRLGASYWLYMDTDCFIRVFREDVDIDRTWTNVVKNRDELEALIKLLITDSVVRTRFSDWSWDNEQYSSLPITNDFEQRYSYGDANGKAQKEEEKEESDVPKEREKLLRKTMVPCSPGEDQNQETQTSVDDIPLALRRSARVRKPSVIISESISQLSNTKRKRSTKSRTKSVRQSRRKPSSSSDSPSEEEYHSDDYQSQISSIDHFFELEEEDEETFDEQSRVSQTSPIPTLCYVCSHNDRPEVLLLCDHCNDAYHLECLRPILLSVPEGDWFCPLCEHKKLATYFIDKFLHLNALEISKQISQQQKIEYNNPISEVTTTNDEESVLSTSQYGRRRRLQFDMKELLSSQEELSDDSDTTEEYTQATHFDLQFPEKINRLLHRRDHLAMRTCPTRRNETPFDSEDINEKLGSPLVYVNCEGNSRVMKSAITNSKQTSQIVRRWNDVQRRSRLRALTEISTSEYNDENSLLHPDEINQTVDNGNAIIQSQINLVEPMTDTNSTRNLGKQLEENFDRLTRDIQLAVNEAHTIPTQLSNQRHTKPIQKTRFSPYTPKMPRSLLSPKSLSDACNIFRSNDSPLSVATSDISDVPKENFASSSIEPLTNV